MTKLASDLATFYRQRVAPGAEPVVVRQLDEAISMLDEPLLEAQRTSLVDRRRDASRPFMLFVVGVGNAGKSSLINAMAGQAVAPRSVQPLTWKIDAYEAAGSPGATLRWADGRETEHTLDEAKQLCADEEANAEAADARGELYTGAIIEARWRVAGTRLPPNVQIVDTPGLHQIRSNLRDDPNAEAYRPLVGGSDDLIGLAQVYFHRADAVLWVFDATNLDDISGNAVDDLEFYDRDQYAVINKVDALGGVSPAEAIDYARTRVGAHFDRFFALSAKQACKDPETGGLPELLEFVRSQFVQGARRRKVIATVRLLRAELGASRRIAAAESTRLLDALTGIGEATKQVTGSAGHLRQHHGKRLERALSGAFQGPIASIDGPFVESLAALPSDDARQAHLRRHLPTADVPGLVRSESEAAAKALNVHAQRYYGQLQVRDGRYDFSGRQVETLSFVIEDVVAATADFKTSLEVSVGNIDAWSGDDLLGAAIGAYFGALILGPIGLLGALAGKFIFAERKWAKRATELKAKVRGVQKDIHAKGVRHIESDLDRVLHDLVARAEAGFAASLGFGLSEAARRSDALIALAERLDYQARGPIVGPVLAEAEKQR